MLVATAALLLGGEGAANPGTTARSAAGAVPALGRRLFFDARLSADGTVACSTCHDPARAFTDGRPTSVGIKGRVGQRNAPTILSSFDSPFDRFVAGDTTAITAAARRGWELSTRAPAATSATR
jgi:cytochrome c peroxidase